MLRAAICDDESIILQQMKQIIETAFARKNFSCELSCFQSGTALLSAHREMPFDILFLDICIPDCNGFDIAKAVRQKSEHTLILFITSKDELVYDSFDYRPFYFLRKGDSQTLSESLDGVTNKIIAHIKRNEIITLELGVGEYRTVSVRDIEYLKSNAHYSEYYLKNEPPVSVRQSLSESAEIMERYGFVRVHRQYIVNIYAIKKINLSRFPNVELYSGKKIPLGRTYKDIVSQKYQERIRDII